MTVIVRESHEFEDAAVEWITAVLNSFDGPCTLALAGGSTPAGIYRRLVDAPVDWSRITVWLGDERWVPADDPQRNAKMAAETLLDHVPARFLSPNYELGDPETAALDYEHTVDGAFVTRSGSAAPDLVLLGMGDDGHTASLFPDTEALEIEDRHYVANWVEDKDAWRLTATFPLLWSARKILFLVSGESKAAVLAEILEEGLPYPAQRVAEGAVDVTWLVDRAAARDLTGSIG